jgi:stage III sporulation protein AF
MEQEIFNWIKNIVIYMIINTIIMNLLGDKSYKKYVSIVSGMILVLIVISPFTKLMKLDDNLDYFLQYNLFSSTTADYKNQLEQAEEEQDKAVFAGYKEKIKEQVKELLKKDQVYLKSCSINLDEDPKSDTFGEIRGMDITASADETQETGGDSLIIEDIEIGEISMDDKDKKQEVNQPSPLEISIKNELSDFYNMEQGNINISIQGG